MVFFLSFFPNKFHLLTIVLVYDVAADIRTCDRFAAKEAVIKAHPHLSLTMENVQILRQKQADVGGGQIVYSGAPIALIRAPVDPLGEPASGPVEAGAAARHGGISEREGEEYEDLVASVSISHDADMATAVCIGIDQTIPPPSAEEEVEEHGIVGVEDVDKADVMDSERTEAAPAPAAGTIAGTSEVQTGRMSLWEKFGRKETTTITTTSTTTSQKEGASAPGPALVDEAQQDLEFLVVHLLCDAIGHTERFVNQAISVSGKYEVKWSPERVQLQRRYNRLAQQFSYLSRKWEQRKQQRKSWSSTSTIWPPKEYHGYWTDCAFRIQREVKVLTAVCSKVKAMARGLPVSAKGEKKPTVPGDSLVALMLAIEPSVQFLRHIVYRFLKQHELGLKEEQDRDQDRDQAGPGQGGKVDASEE